MPDTVERSTMESNTGKGPDEKYCLECGRVIRARAEICPHCGVRQPGLPGDLLSDRNRIVAAVFALLLGTWGIHKFYLGKIGQGILYAVFFWTAIPTIVGFIEGIVYLVMTDAEFAAKYGRRADERGREGPDSAGSGTGASGSPSGAEPRGQG